MLLNDISCVLLGVHIHLRDYGGLEVALVTHPGRCFIVAVVDGMEVRAVLCVAPVATLVDGQRRLRVVRSGHVQDLVQPARFPEQSMR